MSFCGADFSLRRTSVRLPRHYAGGRAEARGPQHKVNSIEASPQFGSFAFTSLFTPARLIAHVVVCLDVNPLLGFLGAFQNRSQYKGGWHRGQ